MDEQKITRRAFLKSVGTLAVSAILIRAGFRFNPWKRRDDPLPFIFSPERKQLGNGKESFSIGFLDLRHKQMKSIETEFLGHSAAQNPKHENHVVMFPQRPEPHVYQTVDLHKGTLACQVDLIEGRVTNTFQSRKDRHFFGHGTFSKDGRHLFSTANDIQSGKGIIEVRDGKTFEFLHELPSYGGGPHEMKTIENGKVAVICNYGADPAKLESLGLGSLDPSLSYVDLESGKLLHQDRLSSKTLSIRHVAITESNDAAIGLYHEGKSHIGTPCVALKYRGGELTLMTEPKAVIEKLNSTALSLAIHEPTLNVGVTHPVAGRVTFWNIKNKMFLKSLEIPSPQGITLTEDNQHFVITCNDGHLTAVSTANLEPVPGFFNQLKGLNWRHASNGVCYV